MTIAPTLKICILIILTVLLIVCIDFLACSYSPTPGPARNQVCRAIRRLLSPATQGYFMGPPQ